MQIFENHLLIKLRDKILRYWTQMVLGYCVIKFGSSDDATSIIFQVMVHLRD